MKKKLKRVGLVLLVTAMVIPCFKEPIEVDAATNAKTIAELRKELNAYKAKKQQASSNQTLTQNQINQNKNDIAAKQTEIETSNRKIEEATAKIGELEVEIEDTEEKIKELMRQEAIADGDNVYLEYVFGAKNVSDFIIRYSVSEKMAAYNEGMINDFESKIKENEQLKVDLANRKVELANQITSLEDSLASLGNQLNTFVKEALDSDKEIAAIEKLIKQYQDEGCGENDLISTCSKMQSDTGFLRPLTFGVRTSNFGYRINPVTGAKYDFHSGVDIGGNREGTPIYSTANGKVAMVINRSSCGGNQVYIHHTINGIQYTSTYMHMLKINVKVGDIVTNRTVIGTVGGTSTSTSWGGYDRCTTGAHLHFSLAKGWYGVTYMYYSQWVANLVDPGAKQYANIPGYGLYFNSRSW